MSVFRRTAEAHIKHKCTNMKIQIEIFPKLMVKSGMHGLGVFAAENIRKGVCIGEYVAELFPIETYNHTLLRFVVSP